MGREPLRPPRLILPLQSPSTRAARARRKKSPRRPTKIDAGKCPAHTYAANTLSFETALVAPIVRDFFVCEERERHYAVDSGTRKRASRDPGIAIRYLPRFRVRPWRTRSCLFNGVSHLCHTDLRKVARPEGLAL